MENSSQFSWKLELFSYYEICAIWLRSVKKKKLIYYKHAKINTALKSN